jgi:hypothetical protein
MNNFDSNRAIHGDMINYVVLGNDGALVVVARHDRAVVARSS